MNRSANFKDMAFRLQDMKVSFLPTCGKKAAVPWKEWMHRHPTRREIHKWFSEAATRSTLLGTAVICGEISRLVAIDTDSRELAVKVYRTLPKTDMMTRTAKGVHFYFQIEVGQIVPTRIRVNGMLLEVKGEASYCLCHPSIHPETRKQYEMIGGWNLDRVPFFKDRWIEQVCGPRKNQEITRQLVKNVDAYLARVESTQGQHGSSGLVRAAAICRDAGLTEAQTMAKLMEWNQGPTVNPSWSTEELARAISRTYEKAHV